MHLQYSAIATAKAALNAIIRIDGQPVGSHPDMKQFMAGIAQMMPRMPRYSQIWDLNQVLEKLKLWSPAKELSLLKLSMKLLMLLLLVSGHRTQSMHQLHLDEMVLSSKSCVFNITSNLKHSRGNAPATALKFQHYQSDPRVCPITYLKAYLKRTQNLRTSRFLFITSVPPHRHVTSSTLARWSKTVLNASGIDTTIYGAHSTRAASASAAAMRGVPIDSILKQGCWKTANMFNTWYNRPITKPVVSYQQAILNG